MDKITDVSQLRETDSRRRPRPLQINTANKNRIAPSAQEDSLCKYITWCLYAQERSICNGEETKDLSTVWTGIEEMYNNENPTIYYVSLKSIIRKIGTSYTALCYAMPKTKPAKIQGQTNKIEQMRNITSSTTQTTRE